jgi:cytochrome c-type biogenesis protein CcmH/NrfG
MPVVTLWLFAAGGAAVARRRQDPPRGGKAPAVIRWPTAAVIATIAVVPVLVGVSQERLDESVEEFAKGDCRKALAEARGSLAALSVRARPYEIIGFCAARSGRLSEGVRALQLAVDRDPRNWEYHYGLAVVRAGAGLDPRPAARAALRLNRFHVLTRDAGRRFGDGGSPQSWRTAAQGTRLPKDLRP